GRGEVAPPQRTQSTNPQRSLSPSPRGGEGARGRGVPQRSPRTPNVPLREERGPGGEVSRTAVHQPTTFSSPLSSGRRGGQGVRFPTTQSTNPQRSLYPSPPGGEGARG